MELMGTRILLRDMVMSDVADRVYWESVENEWQQWDGPWDYEGKTEEELRCARLESQTVWATRAKTPEEERPSPRGLEICLNGPEKTHIGWCGVYQIDEDCCICDGDGRFAVGLTIPSKNMRGKGYAAEALPLYMGWLNSMGISEVYTQTWSGNLPMIALAKRMGFEECMRKKNLRLVRGQQYDGVTFRMNAVHCP